jgi:PEP-CTERM motif
MTPMDRSTLAPTGRPAPTPAGPSRLTVLPLLAALALLALAAPSRAGLVLIAQDSATQPGGTGAFDVILENESTSTQSVTVGGFSVDLKLANTNAVTFTAIDANTTLPYIFTSSGSFGFIGTVSGGGIEVTGNDLALPPADGVTLDPGTSFGLAHILYQVAANAGGMVPVPFVSIGAGTSLADAAGQPITSFVTDNGVITVVPEPASFTLLALGFAASMAAVRIRRRSSGLPRFRGGDYVQQGGQGPMHGRSL